VGGRVGVVLGVMAGDEGGGSEGGEGWGGKGGVGRMKV